MCRMPETYQVGSGFVSEDSRTSSENTTVWGSGTIDLGFVGFYPGILDYGSEKGEETSGRSGSYRGYQYERFPKGTDTVSCQVYSAV